MIETSKRAATDNAQSSPPRRRRSFRRWLAAGAALAVVCTFIAASYFARRHAPGEIARISLSPSRRHVAFVTVRNNFPKSKLAQELAVQASRVTDLLGVDSPWIGFDVRLHIASTTATEFVEMSQPVDNFLSDVCWSPDEASVFYDGDGEYIRPSLVELNRYDGSVAKVVLVGGGRLVTSYMTLSPSGRHVACTQLTGVLSVLEFQSGKCTEPSNKEGWFGRPCWNADGSTIYCLRFDGSQANPVSIGVLDIPDHNEDTLCSLETNQSADLLPVGLLGSPDRKQIGYVCRNAFYTVDPQSREKTKRFECSVKAVFLQPPFDWSESGVCLLELVAPAGDPLASSTYRRAPCRLLVNRLDGRPSEVIATGPFAEARWLNEDEILVLVNDNELWKYSVSTKRGKRLFP